MQKLAQRIMRTTRQLALAGAVLFSASCEDTPHTMFNTAAAQDSGTPSTEQEPPQEKINVSVNNPRTTVPEYTPIPCASAPLRSTDYADIKKYLTTRKTPVGSVEEFVSCLPNTFFKHGNNAFVTQSDSPEAADVSALYPRTILFNEDASTTIAHTGDPDGAFSNTVQMIVHNETLPAENMFVSVTFKPGETPLIEETDAPCARCHDGHHIWGSYRDWPGTFSPKTDLQWVPEDEPGYHQFVDFWRQQEDSPRYKRILEQQRGDNGRITSPPETFAPRNPYAPGNGDFLDKIIPIQARVLQGKMDSTPLYQNKKHLLASNYLGCNLPDHIAADTEKFLEEKFKGTDIWDQYQTLQHSNNRSWHHDNDIKTLRILMLSQEMGAPYKKWPLTSGKATIPGVLDDNGPAYNTGSGATLLDHTFREIRQDLMSQHGKDSPIHQALAAPHWKDPYYSYIAESYHDRIPAPYPQGFKEECAALSSAMLAEPDFERAATPPTKTVAEPSTETEALTLTPEMKGKALSDFKKYCGTCHGPKGDAEQLPLHNLSALANYGQDSGDKDIVAAYLRTEEMPPSKAKLHPTAEERQRMINALSR